MHKNSVKVYRIIISMFSLFLCLVFLFSPYVSAEGTAADNALNAENAIIKLLKNSQDIASGQSFEYAPYVFNVADKRDELIIVTCSEANSLKQRFGVIDTTSGKVILPFRYKLISFIPNDRMFIMEQTDAGEYLYYNADKGGDMKRLSLDGTVVRVDKNGYITLAKYINVKVIELEQQHASQFAEVPRMALLDDSYAVILDFVIDGVWPTPIVFEDDLAIVQTDATEWYRHSQYVSNNAKYGVIDRSGRWSIPPIYTSLQYLGGGSFEARKNGIEIIVKAGTFQSRPSSWADADVNAAIAQKLVPVPLQHSYTEPITRADFCALAVSLYETVKGMEIKERTTFTDTCLISVEKAAAVGIVNGVGEEMFAPDELLTREQAAVIIARLSAALGCNPENSAETPTFLDTDNISPWAASSVAKIQSAGIMNGIGNNMFAPKQSYTKEQSIITILRLFKLLLL